MVGNPCAVEPRVSDDPDGKPCEEGEHDLDSAMRVFKAQPLFQGIGKIVAQFLVDFLNDGHDLGALYSAFRKAYVNDTENPDMPSVIVAKTVMGKGISFMEGDAHFHGVAPNAEQVATALEELGQENNLESLVADRKALGHLLKRDFDEFEARILPVDTGTPRTYEVDGGVVDSLA